MGAGRTSLRVLEAGAEGPQQLLTLRTQRAQLGRSVPDLCGRAHMHSRMNVRGRQTGKQREMQNMGMGTRGHDRMCICIIMIYVSGFGGGHRGGLAELIKAIQPAVARRRRVNFPVRAALATAAP